MPVPDIRFPSAFNGADMAVTVTERFAATGGGGVFKVRLFRTQGAITRAQSVSQCACRRVTRVGSLDVFGEADR
jgi:hypothetical protein